ncbi:GTP pyrophosphokinase family protein [Bacillus sp. LL01]|uniref:GTP pyrophosphokinase n=1 Tax=Bacillus sp. LL01 TaxID=1665556 RepID=UPI000B219192|nr:GTP pyrophosphokinase family protein [Bacillus sp. LL01]
MTQQMSMNVEQLKAVKQELTRFMMMYKFALDEMNTKINILQEEFKYIHSYNPIEHTKSRIKTPQSIFKKVQKKQLPISLDSIKENIHDIAGIRISCSFISDIYKISDMLQQQKDITVIECKDYIKNAKPNGYQSLHLILEIPVFMSDREENVKVEIQIRTVAMDFWASLEHKIYYKYKKTVPEHLLQELKEAADVAAELDLKMERIHEEVNHCKKEDNKDQQTFILDSQTFKLPYLLMKAISESNG